MMRWLQLDSRAGPDLLGYLPMIFSEDDQRSAREQVEANYGHGGGWRPLPGFELLPGRKLRYKTDPVMHPLFGAMLRDELIHVYEHSWVMITQPDGTWEVSRMD
jgi:hypothetical protein